MAVPSTYMFSSNHVADILTAVQQAGVPQRFTQEFLKSLGFTSSNDRAIIGVLKSLGFLDQSGAPTARYRAFRNQREAPYVLADAIREAYSDLFLANENAQTLPAERIKGILATRVDKGDSVVTKMASTFRALVAVARWDREPSQAPAQPTPEPIPETDGAGRQEDHARAAVVASGDGDLGLRRIATPEYHYNIQIHLPATKDITVYNAIFKSLREHLL
jgi:Family of unknown function (DUF5343)